MDASPTITTPTISGHPTVEGVTSTGATGTGNFVFDNTPTITAPTISGHPTVEGVTTTGATGTGKMVFDNAPTLTGVTIADGNNITVGSGTGTQVGTATSQKLGFYGTTPVAQPSGDVATALSNLGLVATPSIVATTNADLTGPITSSGNATSIASQTGTGTKFVMDASPTITTPTISGHPTIEGVTPTGATGTGDMVFSNSPTFTTPNIGTATGDITGNAATVTTNANLTGPITSSGNTTSIASQTGTGTKFVMDASPTITTPTISGHPTVEGVTTTGATGTGKMVFDNSPSFTTPNIGTATGDITGNAATATALQNARTINGTSFDGTGNITVTAAAGTLTGTSLDSTVTGSSLTSFGNSPTFVTPILGTPTSGDLANCTFPTLNQSTTGNAATATALQTARTINGTSFDGTGNITVTADASTLTGSSLNSTVTGSSLTSVGTITGGTWTGSVVAGNYGGTGVNNSGKTITLGGNLTTSGANPVTFTTSGSTSVSLPTSGTLMANPFTTTGDIMYSSTTGTPGTASVLTIGGSTTYLGVTAGVPGWKTPVTTPAASTLAGWDANKNLSANSVLEGTLSPSSGAGATATNTTAEQIILTGSAQTVTLPGASMVVGQQFKIYNTGAGVATINSSGGTKVDSLAGNTNVILTALSATPSTAAGWTTMNSGGALFNVRTFTSGLGQNYTPSTGTTAIMVEVIGGGGGGGSCSATTFYGAGGGGGGGYTKAFISGITSSTTFTYTVAASVAAATAGQNSSFVSTSPALTLIANGGALGGAGVGSAGASSAVAGGAGGTASGGIINQTGQAGGWGIGAAYGYVTTGGAGGNSFIGGGGSATQAAYAGVVNVVGNNGATNTGGGGSGAAVGATAAAKAGGTGAAGLIIIYEYH